MPAKALTSVEQERVRIALRQLMEKADNQTELAKTLGCSQQHISLILKGGSVGALLARKIALFLGVSFDSLLAGDHSKRRNVKCLGPAQRCDRLDERLAAEANAYEKGLVLIVAWDMEAKKNTILGVTYKRSSGDAGLMLNFCPFCGEKIQWWEQRAKAETTTEAQS